MKDLIRYKKHNTITDFVFPLWTSNQEQAEIEIKGVYFDMRGNIDLVASEDINAAGLNVILSTNHEKNGLFHYCSLQHPSNTSTGMSCILIGRMDKLCMQQCTTRLDPAFTTSLF